MYREKKQNSTESKSFHTQVFIHGSLQHYYQVSIGLYHYIIYHSTQICEDK